MTKEIINQIKDIDPGVLNAKFATNSVLNTMQTIQEFSDDNINIATLLLQIHKQAEEVIDGGRHKIESMLITQAQALDVIFHKMMRMSINAKVLPQFQAYADLGLKAQNQCRRTLLALAEIKNPKKATFIKQQNNAMNQQVNNGVNSENLKNKNITNELLSEVKHEALDDRRTSKTSKVNPAVETVVESRSKNQSRKSNQLHECV